MGVEKFIKPREQKSDGGHHNHDGRHSLRQRIDAAHAQFVAWLNNPGQTSFPNNPYNPEDFKDTGFVGGFEKTTYYPDGQGTEIELFVDPLVKVREELKSMNE